MYRVKADHMEELDIKKSRFLCYVHKCFSEEEAKSFILKIKKEHPNANHHCYAFVIGEHNEIQRSNDDGEPSGTAGVPMLECLTGRRMQDIVVVCVRYFGGIKLGAGGLIRAYSNSVSNTLQSSLITQKQRMLRYKLSFSYDFIGKLDYFFRNEEIEVCFKEYEESVIYTFLCKEDITSELSEITNGMFLPTFIQEEIIDIEIQQLKEV